MKKYIYIYIAFIVGVVACKPIPPKPPVTHPTTYTSAYLERYGKAYDSIPRHVFALDVYSEGLELDTTHTMQGSGTNLYISDIFLIDSLFQIGEYHSDTTSADHTFLPGQRFETMPTGIYLLTIVEGGVGAIQVVDSGQMTVALTEDNLYAIDFSLYYTRHQDGRDKVENYQAQYQGPLTEVDKQ